jgi:hypothetical protein
MGEATLIDITPGADGYRVWIGRTLYGEFATLTSAARVASAIHTLRNLPPMRSALDVAGHVFTQQLEQSL